VNNILDAEQLFTQAGSNEEEMFPNTYSNWKKHLDKDSDAVFEPPRFKESTFLSEIKTGKFLTHAEQNGRRFSFVSYRADPSDNQDFIDILCERMPS
jgi:hypothetical protein